MVRITDQDGVVGLGEGAPNAYYGESVESAAEALSQAQSFLETVKISHGVEGIEADLIPGMTGNSAAMSAVSAALYDLHGKRLGAPVWELWGLDPERVPMSSYTIALGTLAEIRQRVEEAADYPILKIKLGTDRDEEIMRVVREIAPTKNIRVDVNGGWKTASYALEMFAMLRDYVVDSVEQPLPPEDIDGYKKLRNSYPIPIFADESCLMSYNIPRLIGLVDGINIKLAKCGSISEGLRMVHTARACDMVVMAGCMIESSLGISAIAQIAPLLDAADFDGAALLDQDPFKGVSMEHGKITLNTAPGLGVTEAGATSGAAKQKG